METERSIDLADLFFVMLSKWKLFLVFAVVCAVLAGTGKYVKDANDLKKQENAAELEVEEVEEEDIIAQMDELELDEQELAQVQELLDLNERILQQQKRYNESIRMNLNADKLSVRQLQYYIKTNATEDVTLEADLDGEISISTPATDIASLYCTYLRSEDVISALQERLSYDGDVLREIINPSAAETVLYISIYEVEGIDVDALASAIADVMSEVAEKYQSVGDYELVFLDEFDTVVTNSGLSAEQTDLLNKIYNNQSSAYSLEGRFTDEQTSYYELYQTLNELQNETADNTTNDKAATDEESDTAGETVATPGISKKAVLAGFVAGFFLVLVCITVGYILSGKLHTVAELRDYYNLTVYGEFEAEESKKGSSKEKQIKEVVAAVALSCKQKEIESIVLAGTCLDENADDLQKIVAGLKEKGIVARVVPGFICDGDALETCVQIKNVILAEQRGKSKYKDIEAEIVRAETYQVNILGVIAIV